MCLITLLEPWYHRHCLSFKTAQISHMKNSRFVENTVFYSLCIVLSTFVPNCELIVWYFDWQLKRKFPSTWTLQVGIHHVKFVRREAGPKLPQVLLSLRVYFSCKLCPLQHEKESVSASCTSVCVLSLRFVPFTYTQRGLSLLHVPPPTCPYSCTCVSTCSLKVIPQLNNLDALMYFS